MATAAQKSYWEKLKDPRWQKKRLEVLNEHNWTCDGCGERHETLHVHHGYYAKGCDPWDYPTTSLHVLCHKCHLFAEQSRAEVYALIGTMNAVWFDRLLGYLHASPLTNTDVMGDLEVRSDEHLEGIADAFRLTLDEVKALVRDGFIVLGDVYLYAQAKRG